MHNIIRVLLKHMKHKKTVTKKHIGEWVAHKFDLHLHWTFAGLNLFDLNVAAQEFDGGRQEFGENAIEAMFEERLIPVTTSSNACSSMLHTVGTGETIASEDTDDEDEI